MPFRETAARKISPEITAEDSLAIRRTKNDAEKEKEKYFVRVFNHFHKDRPADESEYLFFSHPQIKELKQGKRSFNVFDRLTVQYLDADGKETEARWPLFEYLKRIGFCGNKENESGALARFRELADSGVDLEKEMQKIQAASIQRRINKAYAADQKFAQQAQESYKGRRDRENQQRSQFEEDPFFAHLLEGYGFFISPTRLNMHHDYEDAIDVLVKIDLSELDPETEEEPLYLGIQRTLLPESDSRFSEKKRKIEEKPLWYLPEYPERNPVLRMIYGGEKAEEYYLKDKTSRWTMLHQLMADKARQDFRGKKIKDREEKELKLLPAKYALIGDSEKEIKENFFNGDKKKIAAEAEKRVTAKTLDVLRQALDRVKEYQRDKNCLALTLKIYIKYEKALKKMIAAVEEDAGFF